MKTEIVRAEGLWADGSMGGLKDFSMVVFGGETIGITGLVDSGIASVSGILSGRSRIEKGTLYIHNEPAELKNIAIDFGIDVDSSLNNGDEGEDEEE